MTQGYLDGIAAYAESSSRNRALVIAEAVMAAHRRAQRYPLHPTEGVMVDDLLGTAYPSVHVPAGRIWSVHTVDTWDGHIEISYSDITDERLSDARDR